MVLKEKKIKSNGNILNVTLEKHGGMYFVKCDGDIYYQSANELYATERFVGI